jgi:hypothetical protein
MRCPFRFSDEGFVMSVNSISGSNWWVRDSRSAQSGQAADAITNSTTAASSGTISNSGSVAANSNMASFLQAFSSDLQALLVQAGQSSSAAANGGTVASGGTIASTGTDTTGQAHHHHHHHHGAGGADNGPQGVANQLVSGISQMLQSGTASAGSISSSASVLASDVFQAIQV